MSTETAAPNVLGMLNRVKLSDAQSKKWDDTRTAMLWHAPAFSHIFYTLLQNTGDKDSAVFIDNKEIPVAAVDGSNVIINVDGFFAFNLNERVFILVHEILHCVFDHMSVMHQAKKRGKVSYQDGTELDYDHPTMNMAMDYVINAILDEAGIGAMPKKDGKVYGCLDKNIATSANSALETYRKIFEENKGGKGGKGGKDGFDAHLAPGTSTGKDPQKAMSDRSQSQWDTEIAAGVAAAKAMGKLPAGLERVLREITEPKVDWREKIRATFNRKVGSGSYDWRRPNRRLITRDIYAPGKSGFGANCVVVAVDTSGSITEALIAMFMGELSGILEDVCPKRIVLMWCDARIGRIDEIEDSGDLETARRVGAPGGGGTAFEPVFTQIAQDQLQPDALVYLTDGYGSFPPAEPNYPVIWGNISTPGSVKYPFGDVVDIPVN